MYSLVQTTLLFLANCTAPSSADGPRPTYVLLLGYPEAPPDLPAAETLNAVDDDVFAMLRFFQTLEPKQIYLHLRPHAAQRSTFQQQAELLDPDWPAVQSSVRDLLERLEAETDPVVYIYYSGHGKAAYHGDVLRTQIFLEPLHRSTGEGADGVIDSEMLSREILDPLEQYAEVHLIIDACQSYFLLQARAFKEIERVAKHYRPHAGRMVEEFIRRHPRVGAALATNGDRETFEDPTIGGLFSYAVRSAGIGLADANGDGRISYFELGMVLPQVLAGGNGAGMPGIVAPSGKTEQTFIDLRTARTYKVCITPDVHDRYELRDRTGRHYAVVHPEPGRPLLIHLPAGETFTFAGASGTFEVNGTSGLFRDLRSASSSQPKGVLRWKLLDEPVQYSQQTIDTPAVLPDPQDFLGLEVNALVFGFPTGGPNDLSHLYGARAAARWGGGPREISLGVRFAGNEIERNNRFQYRTFLGAVSAGGDLYLFPSLQDFVEISAGAELTAGPLFQVPRPEGRTHIIGAASIEGRLRATFPVPSGSWHAVSAGPFGGVFYTCVNGCDHAGRVDFILGLQVGADFELPR